MTRVPQIQNRNPVVQELPHLTPQNLTIPFMSETAGFWLPTVSGPKCDGAIKIPMVVFGRKLGCDLEDLRVAHSEEILRAMANTRAHSGQVAFNGLALTSAIVCLSCSGDGLGIGQVPDIDGQWVFSEVIASDTEGAVCAKSGTLSIVQEQETFQGSFTRASTCSVASDPRPSLTAESGPVQDGQIIGENIRFRLTNCRYSGTIVGDAYEELSGNAICSGVPGSSVAGTWQATRLMEPDST